MAGAYGRPPRRDPPLSAEQCGDAEQQQAEQGGDHGEADESYSEPPGCGRQRTWLARPARHLGPAHCVSTEHPQGPPRIQEQNLRRFAVAQRRCRRTIPEDRRDLLRLRRWNPVAPVPHRDAIRPWQRRSPRVDGSAHLRRVSPRGSCEGPVENAASMAKAEPSDGDRPSG